MPELKELRAQLRTAAPDICAAIFDVLAPTLIPSAVPTESVRAVPSAQGVRLLNDPIWKIIELTPLQAAIIDLPLMQRLRRVRQLGFAHYVYPSAHHSRLEHSIGAMRAAQELFGRLANSAALPADFRDQAEEVISVAALLHDCGHTIFSHVAERVVQRLYPEEFGAIEKVLAVAFADTFPLDDQRVATVRKKTPPASELVSALLVISDSFTDFLNRFEKKNSSEKLAQKACALIIGRPCDTRHGQDCYHFMKNIVSGDLDADKLDYVARDAFFAGLPVSADVHRLLSQVTVATVQHGTKFDGGPLQFGGAHPDRYHLLGIRPSAASALEMFVMTRSYLFERIYGHHKIRATERMVERLLWQRISYGRLAQSWSCIDVFKCLYDSAGDDHALATLADKVPDAEMAAVFARVTERILDRELPMRAIAVANRLQEGSIADTAKMSSSVLDPWNQVELDLSDVQIRIDVENTICKVAGLPVARDVYLDWPVPNPIRENPDIWVIDPVDRNAVLRVNQYFAAEQLSNAYTDVKLVAWVFAEHCDRAKVAAATAAVLHARYDLLLSSEAGRRAKLHAESFFEKLDTLEYPLDSAIQRAVENLRKSRTGEAKILATEEQFKATFVNVLEPADASATATRLKQQFTSVGLSRSYYDDFIDALAVLRTLMRHARKIWRAPGFAEPVPYRNEARFQQSLMDFTKSDDECLRLFKVEEGPKKANGITDVVFSRKREHARSIVVELKSEQVEPMSMYDAHAGQPTQYSEMDCSRVSILYCQFASPSAMNLGDTLAVRCSTDPASLHVVLCLGVKGFADKPSDGGSHSIPVEP